MNTRVSSYSRQDAKKRTVPAADLLPSSLDGRTEPVRLFFSTLSAPATSAFSVQPQSWQPKCACAGRFVELVYPHLGRVWLVYFGSTRMSRPSALIKSHWMAILIPLGATRAKERFKPLFCFRFLPGSLTVPSADLVMFFRFITFLSGNRSGPDYPRSPLHHTRFACPPASSKYAAHTKFTVQSTSFTTVLLPFSKGGHIMVV